MLDTPAGVRAAAIVLGEVAELKADGFCCLFGLEKRNWPPAAPPPAKEEEVDDDEYGPAALPAKAGATAATTWKWELEAHGGDGCVWSELPLLLPLGAAAAALVAKPEVEDDEALGPRGRAVV